MDLIAKLPVVAAAIYRNIYKEGSGIGAIDSSKDWSANFTHMLGFDDAQFTELMRLYLTIHRFVLIRDKEVFKSRNVFLLSLTQLRRIFCF